MKTEGQRTHHEEENSSPHGKGYGNRSDRDSEYDEVILIIHRKSPHNPIEAGTQQLLWKTHPDGWAHDLLGMVTEQLS